MTISIVANTAANYAQSGMRVRNDAIVASTQRLSSGLRVFSAKEDAAALAVGTSLRIENSSLKTATLNAAAGVSALQITDGAMGQISDMITRMLTLATQSSSGHLDDPTRSLVNNEFQDLMAEIDRVSKNLEFGGVHLLAGSKSFQVGTASNINAQGIASQRFDQTLVSGDSMFRYSYDPTTEVMTMTKVDGGATPPQSIDLTALLDNVAGIGQDLSGTEKLDIGFASLGVSFTLDANFKRGVAIDPGSTLTTGPDITAGITAFVPATTGMSMETTDALIALAAGYNTTSGALTIPVTTDGTAVQLGAIAGISYSVNGGPATASGAASDDLAGGPNAVQVFVDLPGGGTQLLGTFNTGTVATTGTISGSLVLGVGKGLIAANYQNDNGSTVLTYKIGAGVTSGEDTLLVDVPATTLTALGLDTVDILTQPASDASITALKNALTTLNQGRATVGAQQLRLEQVSQTLQTQVENNETARSALLDVDVAKEITDLTSNQAMLEAASAMLGRANKMPDMLIELLRNS